MLSALAMPKWLNKNISLKECAKMQTLINDLGLNTVCEEALCPNISECFSKNTATFMILGDTCTRNCSFCAVKKGEPERENPDEPERIADGIKMLDLKYAVITSVTRDDLDDGGAEVFAKTVLAIKNKLVGISIEVLIPDFKGNAGSLKEIAEAMPDVINHNIEVVPRLYRKLRPQADYKRSLLVLKMAKELSAGGEIYTKSGLMVGLGETGQEVLTVLDDLRGVRCDFLSIGQYLSPGASYYPVKEYISPDRFRYYKEEALNMGFLHVESGPYVRSSYHAADYFSM